jgi:retinol dehydrogenase 12
MAHKKTWLRKINPTPDFDDINYERGYDPSRSYGKSKLYNVLFTRALAERINAHQGKVLSVHPGGVRTDLMREMKGGDKGWIVSSTLALTYPLWWFVTKNPWQGCQTTLHCTLSDDVENGSYYADCKKDKENEEVTKANWDQLWQISEQTLGIKFDV